MMQDVFTNKVTGLFVTFLKLRNSILNSVLSWAKLGKMVSMWQLACLSSGSNYSKYSPPPVIYWEGFCVLLKQN